MTPVVELVKAGKAFVRGPFWRRKKFWALTGIELAIGAGDRLAIVGESGSGKTTLARLITGLEQATEGEVRWFGQPLSSRTLRQFRRAIQYVHQDPYASLHPAKTIRQILADPLRLAAREKDIDGRVRFLLRLVGLTPPEYFLDKYPHHLSGGGRQRLAIARALTVWPRLLVADEPVSMVDMSMRAAIISLFKTLDVEHGIATALILHDLGAARFFTEEKGRILVLYRGRITEFGPGRDVLSMPQHPYTALLLASSPRLPQTAAPARRWPGLDADAEEYWEPHGDTFERFVGTNAEAVACSFADRCPFAEARCRVELPRLREIRPGHMVACHRSEAIAAELKAIIG
ncbi:MAG: ATP-binding cassette domain-containing protein [Hydrogenibacillus schlegelii]|nr:ATP-binding cassette domain-containing protein [Hydrogenibacillus schlegelii]